MIIVFLSGILYLLIQLWVEIGFSFLDCVYVGVGNVCR